MRRKIIIQPNEVYGRYKALEEVQYTNPSGTIEKRWKCENIETKEISYKRARALEEKPESELIKDKVNQILVKNNAHQMGIRNQLFRIYKANAEKRNHSFDLTFDEFNSLIVQDCYYCGCPPELKDNDYWRGRKDKSQPNIYTNGVDRIDSNEGYTLKNCVPCCSKCNLMKNTFSKDEFLNQVQKIYQFNLNKSSTTISKESTSEANADGSGRLQN